MEDGYVIGHDAGTSGDKAELIRLNGEMVAHEFEPYEINYPRPSCAEQEPEDWWKAAALTTRRLIEKTGTDPSKVLGIAYSSQMVGLVPVGDDGTPLCPAMIWMDCRAEAQARKLVRKMGGSRIALAVAGGVPSGKDIVCKLKWLKEEEPEIFEATRCFLDVKSYLVFKSTGVFETDQTSESVTGMMSRKTRDWLKPLAKLMGAPLGKMPEIHESTYVVGGLLADAAGAMGLNEGTPVISGMGDAPAAALGAGAVANGDCAISLGTSGLLLVIVDKPINLGKHGMFAAGSADPDRWVVIAETNTAGASLDWYAENLSTSEEKSAPDGVYAAMNRTVAGVEAGSEKLMFMPWLYGERSPVPDTRLRGGFANLNMYHKREHMLRSIYEGVALNMRWQLEIMKGAGLPCEVVRAVGGGALSDEWMQIFADVSGRRFEAVENERQIGAIGAALAVPLGLGIYKKYSELKDIVKVRKTFDPDPARTAMYDGLFEDFTYLYKRIAPFCQRLNDDTRPRS